MRAAYVYPCPHTCRRRLDRVSRSEALYVCHDCGGRWTVAELRELAGDPLALPVTDPAQTSLLEVAR